MKHPDLTGIDPDVAEYITSLENRINDITQMLQNLQRLYFGRKSEKIRMPVMGDDMEQLSIFSEGAAVPTSQANQTEASETVEVSSHKRKKKRTQEEIIADLPVVIHEHTLPKEERRCPRCGNEAKS